MVNSKALNGLTGDQLAKLCSSGALAMIYAHLMSLTNLEVEDGWVAKVAGSKLPRAMTEDAENISFENIDWHKFFLL